jgi:hypothetical protein
VKGHRRFVCSVGDGSKDGGRRSFCGTASYEFIDINVDDKGEVKVGVSMDGKMSVNGSCHHSAGRTADRTQLKLYVHKQNI